MTSVFSPVKEMEPEEYEPVTEVTYLGVVYGTLCALKRMLPRDRGTIVQVGSALAYRSTLYNPRIARPCPMKSNAKVMLLIRHKDAEDETFFNYHKATVSTDK
jgi:NAD(P)-dependent dehydrogenase (short-subunit alcohol dehydrogenase family)